MTVNDINMYMFFTFVNTCLVLFIFQTNVVIEETFTDNIYAYV